MKVRNEMVTQLERPPVVVRETLFEVQQQLGQSLIREQSVFEARGNAVKEHAIGVRAIHEIAQLQVRLADGQ
ncbi:hypothetical protein OF83DRAFT_638672 [Amylostereum chailletii]|nr:hypothetical protein OF83DRAFT_638672 [Amylostereum chailletii]